MEYYSVLKNDDLMKFAGKWMELEKKSSLTFFPPHSQQSLCCESASFFASLLYHLVLCRLGHSRPPPQSPTATYTC